MPDLLSDDEIGVVPELTDEAIGLGGTSSVKLSPYEQMRMAGTMPESAGSITGPAHPEEVLSLPDIAAIPGALVEKSGIPQAASDLATEMLRSTGLDPSAQPGVPMLQTDSLPLTNIPGTGISPLGLISPGLQEGVEKGLTKVLTGFTEPGQALMLPAAGLKPIQALYGAQAISSVPEDVKRLAQARTMGQVGESGSELLANLAMGLGIGKHLLERPEYATQEGRFGQGAEPEYPRDDQVRTPQGASGGGGVQTAAGLEKETPVLLEKPEIAAPAEAGTTQRKNAFGDDYGTTYHATPDDWEAWNQIQDKANEALKAKDLNQVFTLRGQLEAIKNRYGGMPPEPPDPKIIERDKAENAQIDQAAFKNKEMGLASEVTFGVPETSDAPLARQLSTIDNEGKIVINRERLRSWLSSIPENKRSMALQSLLSEEGIHSLARKVLGDESAAKLWQRLTKAEQWLMETSYFGKARAEARPGYSDAQMGHEYIRRSMQRILRMPIREVAEASGKGLFKEVTIDALERVISGVRKALRTEPSKALFGMLDDMQGKLAVARKVNSGTPPGAFAKEEIATPKDFKPEHIDWDKPDAWSPVTTQEASSPTLLSNKLRELGAGRKFSELESQTRRLLVMNDPSGKVHVVSAYEPGRGGFRVMDPTKKTTSKRPNISLSEILEKKFTPQYTMLLKEPVKNFKKSYDSFDDFFADFGTEARERAAAIKAYPMPPGVEEAAAEPADYVGPITEDQAASIINHVVGEVGTIESPDDVREAFDALKETSARNVIGGLRKLGHELLLKEPNLTADMFLDRLATQIYENHRDAKTFEDFIQKTLAQGGGKARPVARMATEEPGPSETARELTMRERPSPIPTHGPSAKVPAPKVPEGGVEPSTSGEGPAAFHKPEQEKSGQKFIGSYLKNPQGSPLGPMASNVPVNLGLFRAMSQSMKNVSEPVRQWWRGFSMQTLPKITNADRTSGEAGARYLAAPSVAASKGMEFARRVTDELEMPRTEKAQFDLKFGTALTEDNLRSIKADSARLAMEKTLAGDVEGAAELQAKVNAVKSLIGEQNSPFKDESEYQDFLAQPYTQEAIRKHVQLWEQEKDPMFRIANELDPDQPLETRGLQTGARINLKAVIPGEGTQSTVGPAGRRTLIRQAATRLRRDPFARRAKGTGASYEGSYQAIMANGYVKEYPVAAQHAFIKSMIDSGTAVVTKEEFPKDLRIHGDETKAYELKLRPWRNYWLQVPKHLAKEFEDTSNLTASWTIPGVTSIGNFLTKSSVAGFAEGSTHISNLSTGILTTLGPTANPMLNTLIKTMGRADILWTLPKVLIKSFSDQKVEMLKLAEIGATKKPYATGLGVGAFINRIDQGIRLVAADTYRKMAKKGWVEDTETGLREFVNQFGQYNAKAQPRLIQHLRSTGVQPFATAVHTWNIQGLRTLALGPNAKATSVAAAMALRADKAAGLVGFGVLLGTINHLLSGNVMGPPGTSLGAVGWIGDDKKLHQFNLARLFGYERGPRITGLQAYADATRMGLTPGQRISAAVKGPAGAALSYATGPLPQFITKAATGFRPGVPMVREAPVMPPTDSLSPLKNQAVVNILTAAQEANPLVDMTVRAIEHKPAEEILQRQFSRYTPRTGQSQETIRKMPQIVRTKELNDYVDYLAKEARKLPVRERSRFIQQQFDGNDMEPRDRAEVMRRLRMKGAWRP